MKSIFAIAILFGMVGAAAIQCHKLEQRIAILEKAQEDTIYVLYAHSMKISELGTR